MINMKHFVVMTHFLKSIGLLEKLVSLKEDLFFIFIGYFSQIWLEYPFFYPFVKYLDLMTNSCKYNYWRLTTDSNQ